MSFQNFQRPNKLFIIHTDDGRTMKNIFLYIDILRVCILTQKQNVCISELIFAETSKTSQLKYPLLTSQAWQSLVPPQIRQKILSLLVVSRVYVMWLFCLTMGISTLVHTIVLLTQLFDYIYIYMTFRATKAFLGGVLRLYHTFHYRLSPNRIDQLMYYKCFLNSWMSKHW